MISRTKTSKRFHEKSLKMTFPVQGIAELVTVHNFRVWTLTLPKEGKCLKCVTFRIAGISAAWPPGGSTTLDIVYPSALSPFHL